MKSRSIENSSKRKLSLIINDMYMCICMCSFDMCGPSFHFIDFFGWTCLHFEEFTLRIVFI